MEICECMRNLLETQKTWVHFGAAKQRIQTGCIAKLKDDALMGSK